MRGPRVTSVNTHASGDEDGCARWPRRKQRLRREPGPRRESAVVVRDDVRSGYRLMREQGARHETATPNAAVTFAYV